MALQGAQKPCTEASGPRHATTAFFEGKKTSSAAELLPSRGDVVVANHEQQHVGAWRLTPCDKGAGTGRCEGFAVSRQCLLWYVAATDPSLPFSCEVAILSPPLGFA